jgi:lysozyme family protein
MAKESYDEALTLLLKHEGGYADHPSDPGGETNFGITVAVARASGYQGPMRSIPMDVVKRIYRTKYWDALRCDELPSGVDYAVFDYGVNSGIGRSGKVLRRVLSISDSAYQVTDAVLTSVRKVDAEGLVDDICSERMRFLQNLKTWPVFGKGWGRRVTEVKAAALRMAKSNARPVIPPPDVPTPSSAQPAQFGGLFNLIAALLAAIFKRNSK